jgi:tRNA pseudouridine38-40 synthase
MQNTKLTLSYEGTHYLGWQKTPMGPSIEEELEKALATLLRHPVQLQAASRTDAGVHAEGQVVNFFTEGAIGVKRLNTLLPKDIRIQKVEKMAPSFHPTLDGWGKEYNYFICLGPAQLPFHRLFSWHVKKEVDVEVMQKAALCLQGKHDFSAFTNEPQKESVREIFEIKVIPLPGNRLKIRVSGNRFLYMMVRIIVGTLVDVGSGKISWEEILSILTSKDRTCAGVTAPAHGLFLTSVFYD